MLRDLEDDLLIGFIQATGVGEDKVGNAVLTVTLRNCVRAVEDNIEGFGMDAHHQISRVFREMVQEVVNPIHQCVTKRCGRLNFLFVHTVLFFEPQRYIFYVDGLHGPSR